MNKFSMVGTRNDGIHFFTTSEEVPLELVIEVLRIIYEGASISIFKGHIESVYNLSPLTLLTEVKKYVAWFKELDNEDIAIISIRKRLDKLNEYVKTAEA